MSDAASTYANALELLNNSASVLLQQRDSLINQACHEGLLEAVAKRLSEGQTKGLPPIPEPPTQSTTRSTSSSTSSLAIAGNKRRNDSLICQPHPSTDRRRQVRKDPKVVIPKTNCRRRPLRRVNMCPKAISQLQSRAATASWDSETETDLPNDAPTVEDLSEDELLHDTPKPVKPANAANAAKPSSPARPLKAAGQAPRAKAALRPRLEHIDWMFCIRADDVAYWRPLSDFPRTAQTLFRRRFSQDYLQKPYHIDYYACMLRNRQKRVAQPRCVNNVTYENRSQPSRWTKTGGRDVTCEQCFGKRRFCARLVKVGGVVKLGFFPLPETDRTEATWEELGFWIREGGKKGV